MSSLPISEPSSRAFGRNRALAGMACGLVLAVLVGACSDDSVEAPKVENITRTWLLDKCEYQNNAVPAQMVDLVAGGWAIVLSINDNGMFRYAWTAPGGAEQYFDGTWRIEGEIVSLTRSGAGFAWQFDAQVQEEAMTLSGAQAEYDFDNDGTPEAATWSMTMHT